MGTSVKVNIRETFSPFRKRSSLAIVSKFPLPINTAVDSKSQLKRPMTTDPINGPRKKMK
jgi:hypothetical protein